MATKDVIGFYGFSDRVRSPQDCASWGPSMTDASQAKDCDVNTIVARFIKTGVLPHVDRQAMYGDFSDPVTYQKSLDLVLHAQEQFDGLDAKVRARFRNDPAEFLEFCSDPKNAPEMAELGLMTESAVERVNAALKATSSVSEGTPPPSQPVSSAPAAKTPK